MKQHQKLAEAQWVGIDPETKAFFDTLREELVEKKCSKQIREWFVGCRDAGLPTDLNADFSDPAMARHLREQIDASCYPGLVKPTRRFVESVRLGLQLYVYASKAGVRTLPVPPIALRHTMRWNTSTEEAMAHLPAVDRKRFAQIEAILNEQAKKQWQGNGAGWVTLSDGRRYKGTVAATTAHRLPKTVRYFIRHAYAEKWEPFTLAGILTPERITRFLYYSSRFDGEAFSASTLNLRGNDILDFFRRGRLARPSPVVIVTEKLDAKIRKAIAEEQLHRSQWNTKAPSLTNAGDHKWYPSIDEVTSGIQALEAQLRWADQMRACGKLTEDQYWQELRDTTLALCTLFCMWRADTAATGSLLHLRTHGNGLKIDENGFAIMERIARAKNTSGTWYPFVPELILPPNVVRYIERLLEHEGRSLAQPLREGEKPVLLTTANHDVWGKDRILDGELEVVPIFRLEPDAPEGLSYEQIRKILQKKLEFLRWGATNPHTFRAAGAIYWTFVQEMSSDLVMKLGLWESEETMRECYARIQLADTCARMARFVPLLAGVIRAVRGRREQAASAALAVLGQMLEKVTNPYEARRLLARLRRHCEEIDQTIAGDLGYQWEPARTDPLQEGELEKLDAFLKGAGYEGGLSAILGRDILATDALRRRADLRAREAQSQGRLRRLGSLSPQPPALPEGRKPRRGPHRRSRVDPNPGDLEAA